MRLSIDLSHEKSNMLFILKIYVERVSYETRYGVNLRGLGTILCVILLVLRSLSSLLTSF